MVAKYYKFFLSFILEVDSLCNSHFILIECRYLNRIDCVNEISFELTNDEMNRCD